MITYPLLDPDNHWESIQSLKNSVFDLIDEVKKLKQAYDDLRVEFFDALPDDQPEYEIVGDALTGGGIIKKNPTHRTVTLRIPKGRYAGSAIAKAYLISGARMGFMDWLGSQSNTDLQKALDEVEK